MMKIYKNISFLLMIGTCIALSSPTRAEIYETDGYIPVEKAVPSVVVSNPVASTEPVSLGSDSGSQNNGSIKEVPSGSRIEDAKKWAGEIKDQAQENARLASESSVGNKSELVENVPGASEALAQGQVAIDKVNGAAGQVASVVANPVGQATEAVNDATAGLTTQVGGIANQATGAVTEAAGLTTNDPYNDGGY